MNKLAYGILLVIVGSSLFCKEQAVVETSLIPLTVLFGNPEKNYPQISPDGNRLAYCAPLDGVLNIWLKTMGKNDDKPITHDTKRGIFNYHWAENSKYILYLQDANGNENTHLFAIDLETNTIRDLTPFSNTKADIIALSKHFSHEVLVSMNKENPKLFDVYHLDLISGALTVAAKNPGTIVSWLADATFKIRAAVATNPDGSQNLLVRDHTDAPWRTLLHVDFEDTLKDDLYCGLLAFSADGNSLFLNSSVGLNTRSLISVDIRTGTCTTLATDATYDLAGIIFNSDKHTPEFLYWQKARLEYTVFDSELTQDLSRMQSLSEGDLSYIQRSQDAQKWIIGFLHDNKSYEYYFYDRCSKQSTFLFCTRPALNSYTLASMKPISFTSRDGFELHGYLTCPVGRESKNMPLIIAVHGGPFYRDEWGYDPLVQLFASRGYACLQINFRGSTGYGKNFLAAGNGQWGAKMHDDLLDGVQWAISQGIADPKKIAIFGASYGGYAALVGATFTPDVFCCAVDYVGPSDLITVLKSLPPYWSLAQWEKRIGKLSDEEFLRSRSPLYKIDNIKIPILVAHGANDVRVKQSQSEQIVEAMKRKGIAYEYLLFPDEGHGFVRPENRMKFYQTVEQFLKKNLDGSATPVSS